MRKIILIISALTILNSCGTKTEPISITAEDIHASVDKVTEIMIHDIFSPQDYPEEWLNKTFRLWGEEYLVEAMLANGSDWRILAALNWLSKDSQQFGSLCPFFYEGRMPGSMWIQKK